MSAEYLPRWQRVFVSWFLNRQMRKAGAKAKILCPSCRANVPPPRLEPELLWDAVMECPECGHVAGLMSFGAKASQTPEERVVEQQEKGEEVPTPPTTRITVENTGMGRVWNVPAKGGCNFLLGFGTVWLTFTSLFLVGVLNSKKLEMFPVMFVGVFMLIGLGILFAGLQMSRASHVLELDVVDFVHTKNFLGRRRCRVLPRESIVSVEMVVFYTQNYQPVHGIEIRSNRKKKIRFGSALTPGEKAWLCQDIRRALELELESDADSGVEEKPVPANAPSRLTVERGSDYAVVEARPGKIGVVIMVVGGFLSVITSFMLWGVTDFLSGAAKAPLLFQLVVTAFMLFWCGGVSIGLLTGLSLMTVGWRMRRTRHLIRADRRLLSVVTTRGRHISEQAWSAEKVRDLRVEVGARTNGKPNYHAIILLDDRVFTFGLGQERSALEQATGLLGEALGRDPR